MRTTLNLADDAFRVAKQVARQVTACNHLSLGKAVSQLSRAGAGAFPDAPSNDATLRGCFALQPQRDEIITLEHVRKTVEREGI